MEHLGWETPRPDVVTPEDADGSGMVGVSELSAAAQAYKKAARGASPGEVVVVGAARCGWKNGH